MTFRTLCSLGVFVLLAGCFDTAVPATELPGGANEPPATPPSEDPPPAPEDPPATPPPSPRNPGDGPTLDPGFNPSPNRIDFAYDAQLSAEENGSRLRSALGSLEAGDRLVISGGYYKMTTRVGITANGTETNTITIEAAEGEAVVIEQTNPNQNGVDFDSYSYLTVKGIEFVGGDLGIRFKGGHHLFFYNNNLHDTASSGITANTADTSYLYFVDNEVHDTSSYGEGFYLGANNAAVITHHTYVVGNHVYNTATDPGGRQGDGIEIKTGSYACVISDNLIENTNYPGILVYGNGNRAERNVIERNTIVGSFEAGIQVASDAVVRNNLIIGASDACILSQPHQDASPSNLTIVHNTLINDGVALRVRSWSGQNIVFANNVLYSSTGSEYSGSTSGATLSGNVILSGLSAFEDLTIDGTKRNATPAAGSALIGAGDPAYAASDDLTGEPREGALEPGAVDKR